MPKGGQQGNPSHVELWALHAQLRIFAMVISGSFKINEYLKTIFISSIILKIVNIFAVIFLKLKFNLESFLYNLNFIFRLKIRGQPKCPGCEKAYYDFCVGCREPFADAAITKLDCGHFIHTKEFL